MESALNGQSLIMGENASEELRSREQEALDRRKRFQWQPGNGHLHHLLLARRAWPWIYGAVVLRPRRPLLPPRMMRLVATERAARTGGR